MSAFPSDVFIDEVLDILENDTLYLALYTSNPQADNSGTEVSGGSYARELVTFTRTGSQLANDAEVRFVVPAATITHYGILDASTGGNLKVYGAIATVMVAASSDELIFPAGALTINFSGS